MHTGTLEPGIPARKRHDMSQLPHSSGFATRTDIILATQGERPGPQAFLVEQSANSVAGAHFHTEPQFQVVVAGSGRLGRHELKPLGVHYANGYTGYGPIEAGAEGIAYVTLRANGDLNKPFYLPEQKDEMKAGPRLNLTSEWVEPGRAPADKASCEPVLGPRADGIGAWMVRVPPDGSVAAPRHAAGGGQFRLVVGGDMRADGGLLGRLGCAFVSAAETGREIAAGPKGLEVLVLQYAAG